MSTERFNFSRLTIRDIVPGALVCFYDRETLHARAARAVSVGMVVTHQCVFTSSRSDDRHSRFDVLWPDVGVQKMTITGDAGTSLRLVLPAPGSLP